MTRDRIYRRPKRPGNRMTRDRNNTALPSSMILPPPLPYPTLPTTTQPPPLSYQPLPNHLTSSHLTPLFIPHFILYHTLPPTLPYTYSLYHINTHHKCPSPYTPLPPPHNPLPTPSCPTVLSTCPTLLHPFSPTHPYHYHYSLPYLTLTSFPTLPYHLPLSHSPFPFLPSLHPTHRHLSKY